LTDDSIDYVQAAVANHTARFRAAAERVERIGELELLVTGRRGIVPFPASTVGIEEAVDRFHELGLREVGAWAAAPDDRLGAALLAHGFQDGWQPHWLGIPVAELPPIEAGSGGPPYADDLPYAQPALPEEEEVAIREGEVAIAHGRLFVHERIAGIYDVGVIERARRRGLGRAVTLALAARARERGCTHAVLNATWDGEQLYRALGFRSAGHGMTWWWFPRP
jgi:ribosomal protein S18 acetylase RimI-like enzyme